MLGEPLLLGLLVAPSWPGLGVALFGAFAFLARHPFKLAAVDRLHERRTGRTVAAERIAASYAILVVSGLALAARSASRWWIPLAVAAPLAAVQLLHDVRNQGRQLLPEVVGCVALAALAPAELLAGGWTVAASFAAWALLASKAVAAVLYVRARLRMDRGLPFGRAATLWSHAVGVFMAIALVAVGLAPRLAVLAFVLLLGRAAFGLSRLHRPVRPQVVGITEMVYGLAFVLAVALGFRAGL